jgi:hypothetical protein
MQKKICGLVFRVIEKHSRTGNISWKVSKQANITEAL